MRLGEPPNSILAENTIKMHYYSNPIITSHQLTNLSNASTPVHTLNQNLNQVQYEFESGRSRNASMRASAGGRGTARARGRRQQPRLAGGGGGAGWGWRRGGAGAAAARPGGRAERRGPPDTCRRRAVVPLQHVGARVEQDAPVLPRIQVPHYTHHDTHGTCARARVRAPALPRLSDRARDPCHAGRLPRDKSRARAQVASCLTPRPCPSSRHLPQHTCTRKHTRARERRRAARS